MATNILASGGAPLITVGWPYPEFLVRLTLGLSLGLLTALNAKGVIRRGTSNIWIYCLTGKYRGALGEHFALMSLLLGIDPTVVSSAAISRTTTPTNECQIDSFDLLAASVTASVILRKLAAYPRQNGLALALRELGKLERTLFTLQWLQDPELRRQLSVYIRIQYQWPYELGGSQQLG